MVDESNKRLLTSSISHIQIPILYKILTLPFVLVKNGLQLIYDFLLLIIWEGVSEGKQYDDGFFGLVFLTVFGIVAVVTHYIAIYNNAVFLALLLVWIIDIRFSQHQHSCRQTGRVLHLGKQDNVFTLEILDLARNDKDYIRIAPTSIRQIEIQYSYLYGGAFQEKITAVWQVYLVTEDYRILIFEEERSSVAYMKAKKLFSSLDGIPPIVFVSSEGCGKYAAKLLHLYEAGFYERRTQSTIRVNKTQNKLHIFSQWKFCNSWRLFQVICYKVINFVLLVLLINCLAYLGSILGGIFIATWNQNLNLEKLIAILSQVNTGVDFSDIFECSVIVGLLFFQGIEISQEEHFWIDENSINFYLDHKKITQLNTKKFETVLFIKEVKPTLLLLASDEVIEVPGLQTKEEFMALLFAIEKGVKEFREY